MQERHFKLAARNLCETAWGPRESVPLSDRVHVHRCTKFGGHARKICLCRCGATKTRKVR